jgi:glycosyltransferase involved in cell wall biosynthesis
MKKLAIVSSYSDLCGNATYTEVLRKEFSKHYDVKVLRLDVRLLSNTNKKIRDLADQHIRDIANEIRKFDYVNIQFEAGLYGTFPKDISRRVKWLIEASNSLILTMHRVDIKKSYFDKDILRSIMSRNLVNMLRLVRQERYFATVYSNVVKEMNRTRRKGPRSIIVHTKRERETIKNVMGFQNVVDHPLTFLSESQRELYRESADKSNFNQRYGLPQDVKTIGIFGFISEYKGHEAAIRALAHLPKEYHLLVFGSQHPYSIAMHTKVDHYLGLLLQLIEDLDSSQRDMLARTVASRESDDEERPFSERVHFMGGLDDEDFIEALICCDAVVLPYWETNQSGSGIAALALETGSNALFANNLAFKELARYFPGCFENFDIGNYIELAQKIKTYKNTYRSKIEERMKIYNMENNIGIHRDLFERNAKNE